MKQYEKNVQSKVESVMRSHDDKEFCYHEMAEITGLTDNQVASALSELAKKSILEFRVGRCNFSTHKHKRYFLNTNFKSRLERENALLRTINSVEKKPIPKKEIKSDNRLTKCKTCSNLVDLNKLEQGIYCPFCAEVIDNKKWLERKVGLLDELFIWLDGVLIGNNFRQINGEHQEALGYARNILFKKLKE